MSNVNLDKLDELILYIAARCAGDESFGVPKLHRVLFLAEFTSYRKTGSPIAREEYRKGKRGPEAVHLEERLKGLVKSNRLAIVKRKVFGQELKVPVHREEADLSKLTASDIATVERAIEDVGNGVDLASRFIGFQAAAVGEVIPVETSLLEQGRSTPEKEAIVAELRKKLGSKRASA